MSRRLTRCCFFRTMPRIGPTDGESGTRMRFVLSRLTAAIALSFISVPVAFAAAPADESLGAWRDYALAGMTPDFSWSDRAEPAQSIPTVLEVSERAATQPRLDFVPVDTQGTLSLAVSRSIGGDLPRISEAAFQPALQALRAGVGLERTMVAPSLTRTVGTAEVTGSVVLAHQQFASWGLGAGTSVTSDDDMLSTEFSERSYGSGVRVGFQQPLGERFSVSAAYQSRVNMDAFQTYRGVFADPGDFDLPAIFSTGLGFRTSERSVLGFGVSRVEYSGINAFTSAALPTRLLALLGDGTSPEFAWRDLTVYSLDWQFQPTKRDLVTLRYTTQQQPEPTSRLLYAALEDTFTDDNYAVEYAHQFRRFGQLTLTASYAPVQYFLGNLSYANRNAQGDQVEVQAAWSVAF